MNRIEFIKSVLVKLDSKSIKYCILRNYDFLLQNRFNVSKSERSIDIVVENIDLFDKVMIDLGFQKRKPSFSLKHVSYFTFNGLDLVSFDVQINGVHWNDMCYFNVLENRVKKSFFYVPSNDDMIVMLICHSILGKRFFKPEYKQIISNTNFGQDYVLIQLTKVFGNNAKSILDKINKNDFKLNFYLLCLKFIFNKVSHIKIFILLFFRWIKWKKFLFSRPLISFIGPDGSGKSSATRNLISFLESENRQICYFYSGRGRKNILPITKLGRVYKKKEKNMKHNYFFKNTLYIISSFMFTLDLLLRYVFKVFIPRRLGKIVITDRYCSDIYLMKNVPLFMKKFFLSLFPKPNLTFYLYQDTSVLLKRRPNEDLDNLNYQLSMYNELSNYMDAIKIKTENYDKDKLNILTKSYSYILKEWF